MKAKILVQYLAFLAVLKSIQTIKVLSTDSSQVYAGRKGQAELLNSSLFGLGDFSVCLRFLTFRFTTFTDDFTYQVILSYLDTWMFAGFVAIPCDQKFDGCTQMYKDRLGQKWKHGAVLGYSRYGAGELNDYYSLLRPRSWNSLCITASAKLGVFMVNLNGLKLYESRKYTGFFDKLETNLVLMNDGGNWGDVPLHGMLTDVNIWGSVLTEKETEDWAHCSPSPSPDVIAWKDSQLNTTDLLLVQLDQAETCLRPPEPEFTAFQSKTNFQASLQLCRKVGGSLAVGGDSQSLAAMLAAVQETCGSEASFFSGHTDLEQEGQWLAAESRQPLNWHNWQEGFPKNFTGRDCIQSSVDSGKYHDDYCTSLLCSVCQLASQAPVFLLRGVCAETEVDRYYLMSAGQFRGYRQTDIIFSEDRQRWEMLDTTNASLLAYTQSPGEVNFPVGLHHWHFSTNCTDPGKTYRSLNIHLAVEQPGNFCCDDGECFDSELTYNLFADCEDRTDEKNFTFVNIQAGYDKYWPPVYYNKGSIELLRILTTFTVIDVFDIQEQESYFGLDFIILMKWYDKDLRFHFLKNYVDGNTLYAESIEKIWHPILNFEKKMTVMEDFTNKIFISKVGEARLLGEMDDIHVIEEYNGKENALNMLLKKRIRFSCPFDNIKNYPFGTQNCSLKFFISGAANNLTKLVPRLLIDNGPKEFGRYVVKDWLMSYRTDEYDIDKNKIEVSIILERKIAHIFMVTYVPTILLNVINQATNYISGYIKYDLLTTVNITCMMVLASVYLSVSASLPTTSSIKPVEIWLLFNLAYPALVILTNIVLQFVESRLKRKKC